MFYLNLDDTFSATLSLFVNSAELLNHNIKTTTTPNDHTIYNFLSRTYISKIKKDATAPQKLFSRAETDHSANTRACKLHFVSHRIYINERKIIKTKAKSIWFAGYELHDSKTLKTFIVAKRFSGTN